MPEEIEAPEIIRSADEVARRCVVLYAVLAAGHGGPKRELVSWLHKEGLWESVSPEEASFFRTDHPTQQQRINATWRAEALLPLLWSLGLITELPSPQKLCDVQLIRKALPRLLGPVGLFVSGARLRNDSEIKNANEEIYQIHWQVRDAQLRDMPIPPGKFPRLPHPVRNPPPESYHPGVVQQRHHALNWLIGCCGQAWDNVTTDT